MKFDIIVADPPWAYGDKLKMDKVKRGAASQYSTMEIDEICSIDVNNLRNPSHSVLFLWSISSMLPESLKVMSSWGFKQKQILVWNKVKKEPLESLQKLLIKENKKSPLTKEKISELCNNFDLSNTLSFGMGRLTRACHEICLVGISGNAYSMLKNKSQRSVFFGPNYKHSQKPEILQDKIELMFPERSYCELFARRERKNWHCAGNELQNEDINISVNNLINDIGIENYLK